MAKSMREVRREETKEKMAEAIKMAKECKAESNIFSSTADGILIGILAVKIFDELSINIPQ